MNTKSELVIIGAGIAGVSAAVYAKRANLDFCLFEAKSVGGQLLFMENIDNYVGLKSATKGVSLARELKATLDRLAIPVINKEIKKVELRDNTIDMHTDDNRYSFKGVIAATGASFKKLGVKGEEDFSGKGVSYCAVCDGFFFKGKEVAVVGGGNTAVEEALYLSGIARKVTLIHRRHELRALDYLQKKLAQKSNIEVRLDSVVTEIKGSGFLEEVVLENVKGSKAGSLSVQGLFVAVGIAPNTGLWKGLVDMDEKGFITSDAEMKTSRDYIWAAGDCRKRPLKQLITAASEGAIAALSVYRYLKGHYISA